MKELSSSRVLVYGVGLMGASLALALRDASDSVEIYGIVRSQTSQKTCKKLGVFEKVFIEEEFLKRPNWDFYHWIVLGTPVDKISQQIRRIPASSKSMITDMGSVKSGLLSSLEIYFRKVPSHNYVSSHPMCGSEQQGPENAIPGLFQNKLCILTPLSNSSSLAIEGFQYFWKSLGMETYFLPAQEHDRVLAYLSHTPHILSSLMVLWAMESVKDTNSDSPLPIMGGGFRDMVRIAGSNPELWATIVLQNRDDILTSVKQFCSLIENTIIPLLEKGEAKEWKEFFSGAAKAKGILLRQGGKNSGTRKKKTT